MSKFCLVVIGQNFTELKGTALSYTTAEYALIVQYISNSADYSTSITLLER